MPMKDALRRTCSVFCTCGRRAERIAQGSKQSTTWTSSGSATDSTRFAHAHHTAHKHSDVVFQVTTGAMLIATSESSATEVHSQFAARTVDKVYLALVRAGTDAFNNAKSGEINSAVHRSEDGIMSLAKSRKGEGVYSASTSWEVVDSSVSLRFVVLRRVLTRPSSPLRPCPLSSSCPTQDASTKYACTPRML